MDARRRLALAPLDPDRFLAWAWRSGPRDRGSQPLTLDDLWFELNDDLRFSRDEIRGWFVHLAALVRRNQRLGHDPWDCVSWTRADLRSYVASLRG